MTLRKTKSILAIPSLLILLGWNYAAMPAAAVQINVVDFGANGSDALDDTAAIQAAVDSVAGGAEIFFPSGNYLINTADSEGVDVTNKSQLIFYGSNATIRRMSSAPMGNKWMTVNNSDDITVRDLTFDSNGNTQYGGLSFYGSNRVVVERNNFIDSNFNSTPGPDRYALNVNSDPVYGLTQDIKIQDNYFEHMQVEAMANNMIVERNVSQSAWHIGFVMSAYSYQTTIRNVIVRNNQFVGPTDNAMSVGIDPSNASGFTFENVYLMNNEVVANKDNPGALIFVGNPTATGVNTFRNIQITGNEITDNFSGTAQNPSRPIEVDYGPGVAGFEGFEGFNVSNNTYQNLGTRTSSPVKLELLKDSSVVGNSLSGNISDGILITSSENTAVAGNRIEGIGAAGSIGVQAVDLTNSRVEANNIKGMETGMLVDGASPDNIVRNNVIWLSQNGIDVAGDFQAIYNNTISATNTGLIVAGNSNQVRNNIAHGGSGLSQPDIKVSGNFNTVANNLFPDNDVTDVGIGNSIFSNSSGDPQFVNGTNGDFHLQAGSPAENTGDTLVSVPFDYDRVSRPQNGAHDMGALENHGVLPSLAVDTLWRGKIGSGVANISAPGQFTGATRLVGGGTGEAYLLTSDGTLMYGTHPSTVNQVGNTGQFAGSTRMVGGGTGEVYIMRADGSLIYAKNPNNLSVVGGGGAVGFFATHGVSAMVGGGKGEAYIMRGDGSLLCGIGAPDDFSYVDAPGYFSGGFQALAGAGDSDGDGRGEAYVIDAAGTLWWAERNHPLTNVTGPGFFSAGIQSLVGGGTGESYVMDNAGTLWWGKKGAVITNVSPPSEFANGIMGMVGSGTGETYIVDHFGTLWWGKGTAPSNVQLSILSQGVFANGIKGMVSAGDGDGDNIGETYIVDSAGTLWWGEEGQPLMQVSETGDFNYAGLLMAGGATGEAFLLPFIPPAAVPGDFDGDGDVDGADFVAWQTNFPKASGAMLADGDADADGDVDGADFVVWQTNFPFTPSPSVIPVPEPPFAISAIGAMGWLIALQWRYRS